MNSDEERIEHLQGSLDPARHCRSIRREFRERTRPAEVKERKVK